MDRVQRTRKVVPIIPIVEVDEVSDERQDGETESDQCDRIVAKYADKAKTPTKAIRAFCVACMGGYVRQVELCTALNCVLYPFRKGVNPFHGRTGQAAPKRKK